MKPKRHHGFKEDYIIVAMMLVVIIIPLIVFTIPVPQPENTAVFQTSSGNVTVFVEVMRTKAELQKGLMYRENLGASSGMLFIFSPPQNLNFWMKNTLIPLDMVFISESGSIVKIERDVPPCQIDPCPNYGGVLGKYVVEVNAGFAQSHNIQVGDKVYLKV